MVENTEKTVEGKTKTVEGKTKTVEGMVFHTRRFHVNNGKVLIRRETYRSEFLLRFIA